MTISKTLLSDQLRHPVRSTIILAVAAMLFPPFRGFYLTSIPEEFFAGWHFIWLAVGQHAEPIEYQVHWPILISEILSTMGLMAIIGRFRTMGMRAIARHAALAIILLSIGIGAIWWGATHSSAHAWGYTKSEHEKAESRVMLGKAVHWTGFAIVIGGLVPLLLIPSAIRRSRGSRKGT